MCFKEGFLAAEKKHPSNRIIVSLIIGEIEPVSAFIVIVVLKLISVSKIRTLVHNVLIKILPSLSGMLLGGSDED